MVIVATTPLMGLKPKETVTEMIGWVIVVSCTIVMIVAFYMIIRRLEVIRQRSTNIDKVP